MLNDVADIEYEIQLIDETTIKKAVSKLYYIQQTCETFSNDDSVVLFSINSESNSFFVGKRWWNGFKCFDIMESIKYLGQYMIDSIISKISHLHILTYLHFLWWIISYFWIQ